MADRNKGTFAFAANFEVKLQGLLDPRGGVTTKSELITKATFPFDGDTIYMKEGMLVTVSDTQEVYMLVSLANILASDYSGWKRVDAGAAVQVEVVDNLTTEDATKALSANQGKLLKELIDEVSQKVTYIYTPKGSVDTYEQLPTEGVKAGYVYNVVAAYGNYPAGTNFAWTGEEWDPLGGSIDLSAYSNTEQVNALIKVETDRATAKENELAGLIASNTTLAQEGKELASSNKTQLESVQQSLGNLNLLLNGNDNPDDDIEDQVGIIGRLESVEEKNTAQDTRLTNLEKLVSGGEAGEGGSTLLEMVNANTADIASLKTRVGNNETNIAALQGSVETLNADADTEGSVDAKIANALSWIEV